MDGVVEASDEVDVDVGILLIIGLGTSGAAEIEASGAFGGPKVEIGSGAWPM